MRGLRFCAGKKLQGKESGPLSVAALSLLLCGVFGVLLFLHGVGSLSFSLVSAFLTSAVTGAALWASFSYRRKVFYILLGCIPALCGLLLFFGWEEILWEGSTLVGALTGAAQRADLPLFAFLFSLLLTVLLFLLECCLRFHLPAVLLTAALLVASPLLGVSVGVGTVFLLAVFQLGFWAYDAAGRKGGRAPSAGRLAGKCAFALAAALSLSSLVALPLAYRCEQPLYDSAYAAEGFVRDNLRHIAGRESKPVVGGKINTGNVYHFGTRHLALTMDRLPSKSLYLRGFAGGEYLGGDWAEANETSLADEVMDGVLLSHVSHSSSLLPWQLPGQPSAYDFLASSVYLAYTTVGDPVYTLDVTHCSGVYETVYQPYLSYLQKSPANGYTFQTGDAFLENVVSADIAEGEPYRFSYFERKDEPLDWELAGTVLGQAQLQFYQMYRKAYGEKVREVYTQVPEGALNRLRELVRETPLSDLNEITTFILYTLHSNTTYTERPGDYPSRSDIAESFLFDRQTGYCQQYALTATLLYRLYGVPARYATGYLVSPESFTLEDGAWHTDVLDYSAHAWTEIYLDSDGWVPVEVTPASDGTTVASYPGFDRAEMQRIMRAHGWDMSVPSLAANRRVGYAKGSGGGFLSTIGLDWLLTGDAWLLLGVVVCFAAVVLPLWLLSRRSRLLAIAEKGDCCEVYGRLVELLHFGGRLQDRDGTEDDFAERLAGATCLSSEEAEKLVDIVSRAGYGPFPTDAQSVSFVRSAYRRVADEIYTALPPHRKLSFRWRKAFA